MSTIQARSKRRVELVVNPRDPGITWYDRHFLVERGVETEMILPSSDRGKELRKVFLGHDSKKLYPFIIMTEEGDDGEIQVIFKAIKPGVAKLYETVRKYHEEVEKPPQANLP